MNISATFLRYLQLNAASLRFVTLASSVAIFQILGSASFLYVRFFYAKTHMCPASVRVFKSTQHRTTSQLSSMITLYCITKQITSRMKWTQKTTCLHIISKKLLHDFYPIILWIFGTALFFSMHFSCSIFYVSRQQLQMLASSKEPTIDGQ